MIDGVGDGGRIITNLNPIRSNYQISKAMVGSRRVGGEMPVGGTDL